MSNLKELQTGSPASGQLAPSKAKPRHVAGFPLIIAEWPRNERELVRVSLSRFDSRFTIDIRCWWRNSNGTFNPGRHGVTLSVKHLPKLAEGLISARRRALLLGLIETGGEAREPVPRGVSPGHDNDR
jgi:hypothetical protein